MAVPRISAVINTLNEEQNLPYALRSLLPWIDEIVVVDMHSEDRTVEIAREFGARVYDHPRTGFVEPARAFAVARATGDWVIVLDADEMIPRALSDALVEIARDDRADVVRIPRLNYMLGAPMMYSRCGPTQDSPVRFFRPSFLTLTEEIHRGARPAKNSRVLHLPYKSGQAIVHFANIDFTDIIDRINRYTTVEAEQTPTPQKPPNVLRAMEQATKTFFRYYLTGKGYRDGWRGFCVSVANVLYSLLIYAKLAEVYANGPREAVRSSYRMEAERLILEYGMASSPTSR
jgi:glycosyltransferase involved in cell wall biosynthesis